MSMGRDCLGTSTQLPVGLVYGGGSFRLCFLPVSLGIALLKRNVKRFMLVVRERKGVFVATEREAHAGWPRGGLSHGNGASFPGVFGAGLEVLVVDTLSLRTGNRAVVLAASASSEDGCGGSNWNRKLKAHVSTSYSKTCDIMAKSHQPDHYAISRDGHTRTAWLRPYLS